VTLRLLSYNIRYGGVGREKALAAVIARCRPDLVVLQEATRPNVVESLAAACGMKSWGASLGDSVAFLSRLDIAHYEWHRLVLGRRRFLEIVVAAPALRIFGVHLSAIHSNVTEYRRMFEVRELLRQIAPYRDQFHLLVGDFNTLAAGAELDVNRLPARLRAIYWLTGGRIRWKALALMIQGGYADGYRKLHEDGGYTFPTWDPQVRLDYLFVPVPAASSVAHCDVVRDAPGVREASDHFPLLAEILVPES
jgi:endonuclease/exonuclease/phosphatase family metal-dependent hydrolase